MNKNRKRNRLEGFNYCSAEHYFVTICVKNFTPVFGDVINGNMVLNEYGKIVEKQWLWLKNQYKFIKLHEYIVMPEHFHGIIELLNFDDVVLSTTVRTTLELSLQGTQKVLSLSRLIGAFKTTSSKEIHSLGFTFFKWHRSFYDRIIETDDELENIREYIRLNPKNYKLP